MPLSSANCHNKSTLRPSGSQSQKWAAEHLPQEITQKILLLQVGLAEVPLTFTLPLAFQNAFSVHTVVCKEQFEEVMGTELIFTND